ncbi:MAG: DUF1284 domain-containing protein [Planctomycetota bacterium]
MKKEPKPSGKASRSHGTPLPVRAHHFLCIAGFRGKGYSDAFVRGMEHVTKRLRRDPELRVRIMATCDAICEACPHQRGGRCIRAEEGETVEERDHRTAKLLGLRMGARMTAHDVYARIARKLGEGIGIDALCGECEWRRYPFCTEGLEELRGGRFFREREKERAEEGEKRVDSEEGQT